MDNTVFPVEKGLLRVNNPEYKTCLDKFSTEITGVIHALFTTYRDVVLDYSPGVNPFILRFHRG